MALTDLLPGGLGALGAIGGSFGGVPGAAIGGLAGRELGQGIQSYFRTPTMQEQSRDRLIGRLEQPNQGTDFGPIEQRTLQQFRNQIVPQLQQKYGDGQGSFATALGQATGDLAERLAALRGQFNLQSAGLNQQREGMLGNILSGQQNMAQNQNQFNQSMNQSGIQNLMNSLGQQNMLEQFALTKSGEAANSAEANETNILNRLFAAANASSGRGQNFDTVYQPGQPGALQGGAGSGVSLLMKILGIGN